jgi:protein phosphatase
MLEASALTDPGKVRANNQDFFRIIPEIGLYLLADGMGGARGGERASQIAVEAVSEVLEKSQHRDASVLLAAVEEANRRVLEEAIQDPRLEGMGTTLVAALETRDNEVAIASVGDSRAWLLEHGTLRAITEDQTWVQEVGRPLGLDEASLKIHPMRHVLTMAVGVGTTVRIRYYGVALGPGDILMLSSDGLHGVVGREEMEGILSAPLNTSATNSSSAELDDKCQRLITAANAAGSPDNVTVVLLQRAAD